MAVEATQRSDIPGVIRGLIIGYGDWPAPTDRLPLTWLVVVVQLALLGYALLAGTHGIQLWGTGVCLVACAALAWRNGSARAPSRT